MQRILALVAMVIFVPVILLGTFWVGLLTLAVVGLLTCLTIADRMAQEAAREIGRMKADAAPDREGENQNG